MSLTASAVWCRSSSLMKRSSAKPLQDPSIEAPYISEEGARRNIVGGVRWLSLQRAIDQNNYRGTSLAPLPLHHLYSSLSPPPLRTCCAVQIAVEHLAVTALRMSVKEFMWDLHRSQIPSRARGANIGPLRNQDCSCTLRLATGAKRAFHHGHSTQTIHTFRCVCRWDPMSSTRSRECVVLVECIFVRVCVLCILLGFFGFNAFQSSWCY